MLKAVKFLLVALVGGGAIFLAYRGVIFSDFATLPGDRYDMVIMSAILEHWRNFWMGESLWHDVGYFYPYQRTIAQTDGYFLIGVIFSSIRPFVDDIFMSVVVASAVLSGIGFVSSYLLTRKMLMFRFETSLLISSAFVLLNSIVSHHQRLQLMSVFLLPLLTSFLIFYLRAVSERNQKASTTLSGCLFGIFYGAMTITCFYVAWFYAFFLMVTFVFAFLLRKKIAIEWVKSFFSLKHSSFIVVLVFLFSLLPFVWAYYPKSLEVGVRKFSSVSGNLISPLELIQVGFDNYLYGGALKRVFQLIYPGYVPWGEYYNVGFSPLIFGLFIAAIFYFRPKGSSRETDAFFLVGVSALFCCVLLFKVDGFSLWKFVYNYIPGAKALNVASVFLMVLALPVLVVVGKYIDSQNLHKSFFVVVAACIIFGELTTSYDNFDRKLENSRVANIPAPPAACRAFYVSGYDGQRNMPGFSEWIHSMYAHNVTAILVSQSIKLPTINGVASFNPPDWNFAAPWADDYDQRVLTYAEKHKVNGLCKLDLNKKAWIETRNALN